MGRGEYPLGAAIRSVREGLSARAGLAAYRAGGGSIRDATWFRIVAETRTALANQLTEASRPLGRRPTREEITPFTTRQARGFIQQVEIFVQDRETGLVEARPISLSTDTLRSRSLVVARALGAFEDAAEEYGEKIIGAAYVGTYELTPGGV